MLNRYRVVKPYRGFESLRLRHPPLLALRGGEPRRSVREAGCRAIAAKQRCWFEFFSRTPASPRPVLRHAGPATRMTDPNLRNKQQPLSEQLIEGCKLLFQVDKVSWWMKLTSQMPSWTAPKLVGMPSTPRQAIGQSLQSLLLVAAENLYPVLRRMPNSSNNSRANDSPLAGTGT